MIDGKDVCFGKREVRREGERRWDVLWFVKEFREPMRDGDEDITRDLGATRDRDEG